jgi:tetratricopeptide (TPR) repeat protein
VPDEKDFLEMPAAAFAAPFLDTTDSTGSTGSSAETHAALQAAVGDRYRIEREIGRGGMATVFLAHDLKHSRAVAIKVLHADAAPTLGAERFVREIETVAGLSHPHILPLYDSGASGGLVYYAMPYVEGESLRDRLARERQLPVPVALGIVTEVADALAYAHERGVVHRDIKPGNILLTSAAGRAGGDTGSHALLADFGIARALAGGAPAPLTATGAALGTPTYMSPEQASGERELDGRSDVYSLGCVLYEMLAGEPPFTGPTAQAVITKRMTGPPPSIRRVRPSVSPGIDAAIARAMAPVPADRFQTADEFLHALRRAESGLGAGLTQTRNRRVVVALAGLVTIAAIAAAFFLWRTRPVVAASASAMVVLPPTPVTPDSALTRLGRELAITLGANLDGVGGIHVTDPLGVLANVDASAPALSLDQARAFAQRLGVRSVVRGTLIRVGDSVRVDVALHRTMCTTDGCEPLATVVVTAPMDDITTLTEQTTWALLRAVWQREGAPTPSLAAVTTRSIPALRAFLEGERAIVGGMWRAAPAAYERAFSADTTFLLAYWRYAFARSYWSMPVDPAIRAKYRENLGRFPPRDSLLIAAEMSDSMSVRYERTKAATERFADYWPAWWTLSERLTHETQLIGTTSRELRVALERTVSLNPRMSSAWTHLFWMALWERDTLLADRVVKQLTALRYDTVSVQEQGFDELAYYHYLADVVRGGGAPRDTMIREPGVLAHLAVPSSIDPMALGTGMTQYGLGREQVAMSTRVLARGPARAVAAGNYLAMAVGQAQRGAWDSSLVALDDYVGRATDPTAAIYPYRMAVVAAWLGGVAPEVASSRRAVAVRDSANLPPAARAEIAWLDGLLASTNRDARALEAARRALRGGDSASAPMLARSLAAFGDALAGERDRAADSLVSLERDRAERGLSRWQGDAYPFLTAVDRLAAARWLRERGQSGDAARLLTWHEAVLVPLRATRQANAALQGLAYLERARAAESLGQRDVARDFYQRFLWLYDAPTPLHKHLLQEGRQALARLGPEAGAGDRPR